jgi:hypothetical protein
MAEDTAAALVIQLSADFKQFQKEMRSATGVFDTEGRKIERRQAQLRKNLSNWALDFSGLGGLNKALVGLTAGAAVGGLAELVKHGIDAAGAIGDVAQQAGVSVEFLQKLRFAATQSGASFDIMDTALTTLNKGLGDFINTGAGRGDSAFKALGIDKLINAGQVRNAEEAFDAISKGLAKFGSEAQKSSLLAGLFGKEAGPKLLQLMNSGANGIAKLEAQAVSLGIVLSTQTVAGAKAAGDRLDALFSVVKAQGVAAIASLAPEIANLADQITKGLPDLITWVERWADWFGLIKISPVEKIKGEIKDIQAQISDADELKKSPWWNPLGLMSMNIDAKKAELLAKLKKLQADLAKAQNAAAPSSVVAPASTPSPKLHVAQTPEELALAEKRKELLAQTGVDAATASAALIVAQDQTNVQLLKGSADYYAAVKKQIDDEYQAAVTTAQAEADKQIATLGKKGTAWKGYAEGVANINDALADKIAAAAEKQKQALDSAGPGGFMREALASGDDEIQQYKDETAGLGLVAGAAAKLAYVQGQLNTAKQRGIPLTDAEIAKIQAEGDAIGAAAQASHDAAEKMQNSIQVADALRTGLEDVGVAGLHGFKSMKDAAAQFLDQIAELILRLYVLRPLIEGRLGPAGTPTGGLLGDLLGGGLVHGESGGTPLSVWGSILGSIWPFAKGGIMTPNGPAKLRRFAAGGISNGIGIFGEAGPEAAVPLPDGRRIPVDLRMPPVPALPQISAGTTVIQNIDLRGAIVDKDVWAQVNQISQQNAQQAVAIYDRNVLPSRVQTLNKFPRRMH